MPVIAVQLHQPQCPDHSELRNCARALAALLLLLLLLLLFARGKMEGWCEFTLM